MLEEINTMLLRFQNSKAPGTDGLPKEFYVAFCDQMSPDLLKVYRECLQEGHLGAGMEESLKKGEEQDLRNLCLIMLLNLDYKLMAKVLAKRFKSVIGTVIHEGQVCTVPGQQIHEALMQLQHELKYQWERGQNITVLNLNLEKAYNQVSHRFLLETLKKMGVATTFVT
ncbi:hypothetical protein Y1Q_0013458 [Alligator mississippiensis]|uniref:Reverse transcriptase domain-containing protein n=1 Tax=Alligator mississippiensis TaxID=8496 RepID=A0A151MSE2_ALLMI|nr:hypothetical protein Y1Q_0013458 [Alligator mississippiensis]